MMEEHSRDCGSPCIMRTKGIKALDSISIRGFKSIASIDNLKLSPVNLVIGANGSGKSNFLGVFGLLRTIGEGRKARKDYIEAAGGANRLLHFGSKTTKEIELSLTFGGVDLEPLGELHHSMSIRLEQTENDSLFMSDFEPLSVPEFDETEVQSRGLRDDTFNVLATWRVYHLNDTSSSSPLRKSASLDDNRFLRPDGSNLAAFLYYLRKRHDAEFNLIARTVRRVAPFFENFISMPLQNHPDLIKLEWRHAQSDQYFDASALSDGTLRFIFLATLLLQPEEHRPSIILIDEPELGLHPHAIELLAALIRQASVTNQVIVSTQSPLLLDQFEPEDVLVAELVDGATRIKRLDSQHLKTWLEDYSLGQLWEKNEIGGRPVAG